MHNFIKMLPVIVSGNTCKFKPLMKKTCNILRKKLSTLSFGGVCSLIMVFAILNTGSSAQAQTWSVHATTVAGGNSAGPAAAQLNDPNGLWVDGAGNIYVSDLNNSRIEKWATGATSGIMVAGSSTFGTTASMLELPANIYMDASNNLYIADNGNNRVQKWASGATSGTTIAGSATGINGQTLSLMNGPNDVSLDSAGNIYVCDGGNGRIVKWAPGATSGVLAAGGSTSGVTLSHLAGPTGLFIKGNTMYIADFNNNRVLSWVFGDTAGVLVAGGNGAGSAANQLNGPDGVVVDSTGNIYISDAFNNRVQMWSPGATSGVTIAGGYGMGASDSQLNLPNYIRLDANMNLYVCDGSNNRVQKFASNNSSNTGVKNLSSVINDLQLYPNPSNGRFTVNVGGTANENVTIIITNMLGEKVKTFMTTTNSDTQVEMNEARGIYSVTAVTNTGGQSAKVVVW